METGEQGQNREYGKDKQADQRVKFVREQKDFSSFLRRTERSEHSRKSHFKSSWFLELDLCLVFGIATVRVDSSLPFPLRANPAVLSSPVIHDSNFARGAERAPNPLATMSIDAQAQEYFSSHRRVWEKSRWSSH